MPGIPLSLIKMQCGSYLQPKFENEKIAKWPRNQSFSFHIPVPCSVRFPVNFRSKRQEEGLARGLRARFPRIRVYVSLFTSVLSQSRAVTENASWLMLGPTPGDNAQTQMQKRGECFPRH